MRTYTNKSPDPVLSVESRNPFGDAKFRFSTWILFHLRSDFYLAFCDKSHQSINYMRWATVGHQRFKRGHCDRVSSLVKRVFKKRISTVWHTTSLSWKGYFGRRRDKNTGLIENTDEFCCPLFQTDEKTRKQRKNPHEFMHQSCHTSGYGTLIGGRFVPRGTPRRLSMKECWWLAATIVHQVQLSLRSIPRRPH